MLKQALRSSLGRAQIWLQGDQAAKPAYAHPRYEEALRLHALVQESISHCYAWGVIQGLRMAKSLGVPRVSLLEFGVAGGNGLVALERIAAIVGPACGIETDIYGFDTAEGLPAPSSVYDVPYTFVQGQFQMDVPKLEARLDKARLRLGLIENTLDEFIAEQPAPVAFISFDMDYYSSTAAALRLLEADPQILMPRVHCFFDDLFSCGDFDGERRAIAEFNRKEQPRRLSPIHGLRYLVPARLANLMYWDKYYLAYIFDHSLFARPEGHGFVDHELDLV